MEAICLCDRLGLEFQRFLLLITVIPFISFSKPLKRFHKFGPFHNVQLAAESLLAKLAERGNWFVRAHQIVLELEEEIVSQLYVSP